MDLKKLYDFNYMLVNNKTKFDYGLVGSEGYGETGYSSIETLISYYSNYFNKDTVFYDLGSGLGKIVIHVGVKYKVKKSCGIEFSKERYLKSLDLLKNFNDVDNINFINDNILNCDLSDATVIYTDNTLFPTNIDSLIYQLIPKNCLVISRKQFKDSRLNNEIIKDGFTVPTNYGTNTINTFLKKF